jgi:hypothetical protein
MILFAIETGATVPILVAPASLHAYVILPTGLAPKLPGSQETSR